MRFRFVLLWFAIIVGFEAYGFFQPGSQIPGTSFDTRSAIEGAVLFGSLGIGVATCLTMGLYILENVSHRRVRKRWAIACLAASSVASTIATPLLGFIAHDKPPWHVLGGERAMGIAIVTGWMIIAAGAGFVIFTVLVFLIWRHP